MKGFLDIYAQQFRTTFVSFVQYRASIYIWMIWSVLEPLIYLVVWSVVTASQGGNVGGFSAADFSAYFIVMMVVNQVTYTWIMYEYEYRIRHGSLSFSLLRPIHPIHADIVANISSKLITLPVLLLVAVLLGNIFHAAIHPSVRNAIVFVPALLLAFIVRFLVEWTLAQVAFWTTRVSAVNQGYYVAALFLAGQMAPLALLPYPVQIAAAILPFRWMISFPVEILLGRLSPADIATGFIAQVAWIVGAYLLFRIVWAAGVKTYSAVGA